MTGALLDERTPAEVRRVCPDCGGLGYIEVDYCATAWECERKQKAGKCPVPEICFGCLGRKWVPRER